MILGLIVVLLFMPNVTANQEVFEDPEGKYTLNVPTGWSPVVSRDGLGRPDVKIIYKNNENGTLKIRRVSVEPTMKPIDYATLDEERTLRFSPGYVKGSTENFSGGVDGAMVTYDFTVSGRPMMGRNYYVKVNPTTVFVLRFTGLRNILGPVRNHTDAMARSFKGQ